jgi:hypothetical protein
MTTYPITYSGGPSSYPASTPLPAMSSIVRSDTATFDLVSPSQVAIASGGQCKAKDAFAALFIRRTSSPAMDWTLVSSVELRSSTDKGYGVGASLWLSTTGRYEWFSCVVTRPGGNVIGSPMQGIHTISPDSSYILSCSALGAHSGFVTVTTGSPNVITACKLIVNSSVPSSAYLFANLRLATSSGDGLGSFFSKLYGPNSQQIIINGFPMHIEKTDIAYTCNFDLLLSQDIETSCSVSAGGF